MMMVMCIWWCFLRLEILRRDITLLRLYQNNRVYLDIFVFNIRVSIAGKDHETLFNCPTLPVISKSQAKPPIFQPRFVTCCKPARTSYHQPHPNPDPTAVHARHQNPPPPPSRLHPENGTLPKFPLQTDSDKGDDDKRHLKPVKV